MYIQVHFLEQGQPGEPGNKGADGSVGRRGPPVSVRCNLYDQLAVDDKTTKYILYQTIFHC